MANQYPTSAVTTDSSGKTSTTTYSYASPVVAKTASYTVLPSDSGTVFTNRGASVDVTFTLPAVQAGLAYKFCCVAAHNLIVSAAGTFKGSAGSGASGAALSGTSVTIAGGTAADQYTFVSVECDGTVWFLSNIQGHVTVA